MNIRYFIQLVQQMRYLQATYNVYPSSSIKTRVRRLEVEVDKELGKLARAEHDGKELVL